MLSEQTRATLSRISVVIPVLNDHKNLARLLRTLVRYPNLELIVVDGGSEHDPSDIVGNAKLLRVTNRGRGTQVARGIKYATREWIWVLHADNLVQHANVECLVTATEQVRWGRFDVTLLGSRWEYRMIEWLMNFRSRFTSICTGDQGMFFSRDILEEIGGFPEQPLMEDIEMSKRLRNVARPFCSSSRLGSSTRKWEAEGVFRTIFKMWSYRLRYFLGASPESLYAEYYQQK